MDLGSTVMSKRRIRQVCCERACKQFRAQFGRCSEHFAKLKLDSLARIKKLSPAERELSYGATARGEVIKAREPESARWEYTNPAGEAALIERCEGAQNV